MIEKRKNKTLILFFSLVLCLLLALASFTSLAYFKFSKVFDGEGQLPILNIDYKVSTGLASDLRNITYSNQTETPVGVTISTEGNNMGGYVRVKVVVSWSNNLNNTPQNDGGSVITACAVAYDETSWEYRNGCYYYNGIMPKDSNIVLFEKINFHEEIPLNTYLGETVTIVIIPEIYQQVNLPENW